MNKIENLALELLENTECRIAVRKAGAYRFPSSYRYEAHRHVEYEINYVSSGKCMMIFDTEYVPLKAGEGIIVSPFCNHGFLVDAKSGCKIQQAEMSLSIPETLEQDFPFSSRVHLYYRIKACEDIVPVMEQIARLHRSEKKNEYRDTMLDLAVVQLMVALGYHTSRTQDATVGIKNERITGIMKYIQDHYNEPIQMEELAKKWKISSRYVRKYFAGQIGMSCSEYITALRMNKAKEMLWESRKTITDIALETGYGTPQYFSRIFKSEVGMSPSEYRSSWKEEKLKAIFING